MNLTPTEREVLRMLCEGMTAREIAKERGVWMSAVTHHSTALRKKLDARTTAQATYKAGKLGLDLCALDM